MNRDEARRLLADTSDVTMREVVLALLDEVSYLKGYTSALKERLDALDVEKKAAAAKVPRK